MKQKFYYSCRAGEVFLYEDGKVFSVLMKKYTTSGNYKCKTFSTDNYNIGVDKYKYFIGELKGNPPARKCDFRARVCKCSPEKCPKKIGGVAYWELFRDACLYRTR